MTGFLETIRRNNDNYRIRAEADETYAALAKLFGIDQQQVPPGILGPTDEERDRFVNQTAPGGQATARTMDAVRNARATARALPMDSPGWRPPDPATIQQQQQQRPQLPPNTEMMMRALQSEDPRVIQAAMQQMPREMFPAYDTRGQREPKTHYDWGIPSDGRDPAKWKEKYIFYSDGSSKPTGIFEMIQEREPLVRIDTAPKMPFDDKELEEASKGSAKIANIDSFMARFNDPEFLEKFDSSKGRRGAMESMLRQFFGTSGDIDAARDQFQRYINEELIASLPPGGQQSDIDIKVFSQGLPDAFTNAEHAKQFSRGLHKTQYIRNAYLKYKFENKPLVVNGQMTNADFFRQWEEVGFPKALQEIQNQYPEPVKAIIPELPKGYVTRGG